MITGRSNSIYHQKINKLFIVLGLLVSFTICGCGRLEKVTPLMRACRSGRGTAKVEKLIKEGANVTAKDVYGNTALTYTAISGRADVAEVLCKHGANVNIKDDKGDTPLMTALYNDLNNNNIRIIAALLEAGAKPNLLNRWEHTVLENAIRKKNTKLIDLLRKYGAKTSKELGDSELISSK